MCICTQFRGGRAYTWLIILLINCATSGLSLFIPYLYAHKSATCPSNEELALYIVSCMALNAEQVCIRGVATGGGQISLPYKFLLAVLFTCGTLTCFDFEIGMTS